MIQFFGPDDVILFIQSKYIIDVTSEVSCNNAIHREHRRTEQFRNRSRSVACTLPNNLKCLPRTLPIWKIFDGKIKALKKLGKETRYGPKKIVSPIETLEDYKDLYELKW